MSRVTFFRVRFDTGATFIYTGRELGLLSLAVRNIVSITPVA
jgi:hypothetical protein